MNNLIAVTIKNVGDITELRFMLGDLIRLYTFTGVNVPNDVTLYGTIKDIDFILLESMHAMHVIFTEEPYSTGSHVITMLDDTHIVQIILHHSKLYN